MHVEASNNAISSMRFHDDRTCDSSLLRVRHLDSEIRKIKTPREFHFWTSRSYCIDSHSTSGITSLHRTGQGH